MISITCTITDKTAGPFQLASLFTGGSVTGITVAPAAGYPQTKPSCTYLSIQADPLNGAGKIFRGDSKIANDGSRQGKTLVAGDVDIQQTAGFNDVFLQSIFVNTDTNTSKFSVEISYK